MGVEGAIADNIATETIRFFQKPKTKTSKSRSKSKPTSKAIPEVWQQGSFIETQFIVSQNQDANGQSSLIETQFVISGSQDAQEQAPQPAATKVDPPKTETETPKPLASKLPTPYEIRAEFEEAILNDLLGPVNGEEEEVEEDSVSDRYLVGLLAPLHRNKIPEEKPEQQDELALAGKGNTEEGTTETSVPPTETMFPSSFGITFCVSGAAESLEITAEWGTYKK